MITAEQYSYPAGQDGAQSGYYEDIPHQASPMSYGSRNFAERLQTGDNHSTAYAGGKPAKVSPRSQSPMAHLPYQEVNSYSYFPSLPYTSVEQPQPVYPSTHYSSALQPPHAGPYAEATIAIPARRSPPLVEDTPKKPLTLACFFCRKRKIACGSPPPGKKDRTCK